MLHPIKQCHKTLLLICDTLDDAFKGLLTIVIIDLVLVKIGKIDATDALGLGIDELDALLPGRFGYISWFLIT